MNAGAARAVGMHPARVYAVAGAASAVGPASIDLYMPALPSMAGELSSSDAAAQATMSACMIGLALGQLITGPLSDRFGRVRPLRVALICYAVLSLGCALAWNAPVLIALRFLQGLAGSGGMVIGRAIVRDLYSGSRLARMYSLLALITGAAPVLAPLAGGQLLRFTEWRSLFVGLAAFGVALVIFLTLGFTETLAPDVRAHARYERRKLAATLGDRQFLRLVLVLGATSAAFFSYLSMSSFVFEDTFGFTPAQFSLLFAGNSVALILGAQTSGAIVVRIGSRRVLAVALAAGVVGTAGVTAAAFAGSLPVIVGSLWLTLICYGAIGPNVTALALESHASRAGLASALLGMTQFLVGPIVAPIASWNGVGPVTLALTMLTAVGVGAAIFMIGRQRTTPGTRDHGPDECRAGPCP